MQQFILQENAKKFRERLDESVDAGEQRQLGSMLAAVERELALLAAAEAGAGAPPWPIGSEDDLRAIRAAFVADFQRQLGQAALVAYLIDPAPGLAIVDVNGAFEQATGMGRDQAVGQPLFMLFPDNPDEGSADGVSHLYASLRRVAETGRPHPMPLQRYDVRNATGAFVERYWRPLNAPLHDNEGRLILLLHIVDEVTDEVLRLGGGKGL